VGPRARVPERDARNGSWPGGKPSFAADAGIRIAEIKTLKTRPGNARFVVVDETATSSRPSKSRSRESFRA
jgi:hypothetical protein